MVLVRHSNWFVGSAGVSLVGAIRADVVWIGGGVGIGFSGGGAVYRLVDQVVVEAEKDWLECGDLGVNLLSGGQLWFEYT